MDIGQAGHTAFASMISDLPRLSGASEYAHEGGERMGQDSVWRASASRTITQPDVYEAGRNDAERPETEREQGLYTDLRSAQMDDESADLEQSDHPEQAGEAGAGQLSEEEEREVEELRRRDQEVRAHEQAHAAAGARNVRYEYQTGPDGHQYAVGGSADIDIQTGGNDPEAKIAEARKARTAAMAPADPSPKDMAVAAKASRLEAEAYAEKAQAERDSWGEHPLENDEDLVEEAAIAPAHFFALA